MEITITLPGYSSRLDDCRNVVLRWLSSRIDPLFSNQVLRRISNCNVNGGSFRKVLLFSVPQVHTALVYLFVDI